jgi:hypothetical protein
MPLLTRTIFPASQTRPHSLTAFCRRASAIFPRTSEQLDIVVSKFGSQMRLLPCPADQMQCISKASMVFSAKHTKIASQSLSHHAQNTGTGPAANMATFKSFLLSDIASK